MRKGIPVDYVPEKSRLTFIKQTVFGVSNYKKPQQKIVSAKALYRCSCGVEKEIFINCVKAGTVISCGCYNIEKLKERAKHGLMKHPLYGLWANVKSRCTNSNEPCYKNYGGRGVKLCDEWLDDPEAFIKWCLENGWRKGLFIDKDIIAREKGIEALLYSPERCQFVTREVNNNNTRYNVLITFRGETMNIVQWANKIGMISNTLQNRLRRRGWSIERALTTPVGKYK